MVEYADTDDDGLVTFDDFRDKVLEAMDAAAEMSGASKLRATRPDHLTALDHLMSGKKGVGGGRWGFGERGGGCVIMGGGGRGVGCW